MQLNVTTDRNKDKQLICRMLHRNITGWLFLCSLIIIYILPFCCHRVNAACLLPAWPANTPVHPLLASVYVCGCVSLCDGVYE